MRTVANGIGAPASSNTRPVMTLPAGSTTSTSPSRCPGPTSIGVGGWPGRLWPYAMVTKPGLEAVRGVASGREASQLVAALVVGVHRDGWDTPVACRERDPSPSEGLSFREKQNPPRHACQLGVRLGLDRRPGSGGRVAWRCPLAEPSGRTLTGCHHASAAQRHGDKTYLCGHPPRGEPASDSIHVQLDATSRRLFHTNWREGNEVQDSRQLGIPGFRPVASRMRQRHLRWPSVCTERET